MNIILTSLATLLMAGCTQTKEEFIVTINDDGIFLNYKKVVNLEKELKTISCSSNTKLKLQAKQGVPYEVLEKAMKQISNAGCMKQLELEKT